MEPNDRLAYRSHIRHRHFYPCARMMARHTPPVRKIGTFTHGFPVCNRTHGAERVGSRHLVPTGDNTLGRFDETMGPLVQADADGSFAR